MAMTRNQMRGVAIGNARYYLRHMNINPVTVSADDALAALDDYARLYRNMVGSQWYLSASDTEIAQFKRDWVRWQDLVSLPDDLAARYRPR